MAQLIIEHALNEYNKIKKSEEELRDNKKLLQENKKLRKLLQIHQHAIAYKEPANAEFQCSYCPKAFNELSLLKIHIEKRHPNNTIDSEGMFALTNKIQQYQAYFAGDKTNIQEIQQEMNEIKEKLKKTELDLLLEKESRMKIEEQLETNILHQVNRVKEELERKQTDDELKAIIDIPDDQLNENDGSKMKHSRVEELMSFQAKQMLKLGSDVQRLVNQLSENFSGKKIHEKTQEKVQIKKVDKEVLSESKVSNTTINQDKGKVIIVREVQLDEPKFSRKEVTDELKDELNQRLASYGINPNDKGIPKDLYYKAKEKIKFDRNLQIQQFRHDYDYVQTEKQIKKQIDEKVENTNTSKPKIMMRKKIQRISSDLTESEKDKLEEQKELKELKEFKKEQKDIQKEHLKEQRNDKMVKAIVHAEDVATSNTENNQEKSQDIKSAETPLVGVLKKPADQENASENKGKKRIRFDDNRIEYEISPNDTSDETSELQDFNLEELRYQVKEDDENAKAPVPAQRSIKQIKSDNNNDDDVFDRKNSDYDDLDDYLDELLEKQKKIDEQKSEIKHELREDQVEKQPKVKELTELIGEKFKTKRSELKLPIGSVNLMEQKKKTTQKQKNDHDSDSDLSF